MSFNIFQQWITKETKLGHMFRVQLQSNWLIVFILDTWPDSPGKTVQTQIK